MELTLKEMPGNFYDVTHVPDNSLQISGFFMGHRPF